MITPIVSKVCTRDRCPRSRHYKELWGPSSGVLVLHRVYTVTCFNTCHGDSPANASIFFCLSRRRHWYHQWSGLPILRGPSQHDRCFVTISINWKVCTHNWHPMSPHHKELWRSSSRLLEKTWPCCIWCTISCILKPVTQTPLVMSVFSFSQLVPPVQWAPHIARSIITRLLLCDHTYDFEKFALKMGTLCLSIIRSYGVPLCQSTPMLLSPSQHDCFIVTTHNF